MDSYPPNSFYDKINLFWQSGEATLEMGEKRICLKTAFGESGLKIKKVEAQHAVPPQVNSLRNRLREAYNTPHSDKKVAGRNRTQNKGKILNFAKQK